MCGSGASFYVRIDRSPFVTYSMQWGTCFLFRIDVQEFIRTTSGSFDSLLYSSDPLSGRYIVQCYGFFIEQNACTVRSTRMVNTLVHSVFNLPCKVQPL